MSEMADRLRAREVTASAATSQEKSIADLRPGDRATVSRLAPGPDTDQSDPATARRHADLGFVPGAEVVVIRRAPLGGPFVVRVAGYEIALRRAQASSIKVVRA